MLDYLAIMGFGILAGTLTGLVPGIHPNTVIFTSLPVYFVLEIYLPYYMCFMVALSVSHTFHDFLPAIFLGAPEAESALSALPGGELAARGEGKLAFQYTVYGGVFAVTAFVLSAPLLYLLLETVYSVISGVMAYVLLFFLAFTVFQSERLRNALAVTVIAGLLGTVAFSMPVNQEYVLMPIFSGLYAVPAILHAFRSSYGLPVQYDLKPDVGRSARGGLVGFLAGLVAGVVPGVGPAISTTFLTPMMDGSEKEFLAGLGGVNTSDIVSSFLALYLLGKARSGASVAITNITGFDPVLAFFSAGIALLAVPLSVPVALYTGKILPVLLKRSLKPLLFAVLVLILSTNLVLTGATGILILLTASAIGYAALASGERRVCMAVLIVPAISLFGGVGIFN